MYVCIMYVYLGLRARQHLRSLANEMMRDDYDGQMIFGDLAGLKLPDIRLTGEEKPRKNLTQKTCPDRGSNPGPLRDKRACYHLSHSGGRTCTCSTKNGMFPGKRSYSKRYLLRPLYKLYKIIMGISEHPVIYLKNFSRKCYQIY